MFHRRSTVEALQRKVHHLERQVDRLQKAHDHQQTVAWAAVESRNEALDSRRRAKEELCDVIADNQRLRAAAGEDPQRPNDVHGKRWHGYHRQ